MKKAQMKIMVSSTILMLLFTVILGLLKNNNTQIIKTVAQTSNFNITSEENSKFKIFLSVGGGIKDDVANYKNNFPSNSTRAENLQKVIANYYGENRVEIECQNTQSGYRTLERLAERDELEYDLIIVDDYVYGFDSDIINSLAQKTNLITLGKGGTEELDIIKSTSIIESDLLRTLPSITPAGGSHTKIQFNTQIRIANNAATIAQFVDNAEIWATQKYVSSNEIKIDGEPISDRFFESSAIGIVTNNEKKWIHVQLALPNTNMQGVAFELAKAILGDVTVSFSSVNKSNYGDYVRYKGMDLNEDANPGNDWKIFYRDTNNIYLIAADFIKTERLKNVPMAISDIYQAFWDTVPGDIPILPSVKNWFKYSGPEDDIDNNNICKFLLNYENWNDFLTKPLKEFGGGVAVGAPTLEMWIESWNAKYPADALSCIASADGYRINGSEYNKDLSSFEGYNDTLYFPHQSKEKPDGTIEYPDVDVDENQYAFGYWLASPSAMGNFHLMRVDCDGYIYSGSYRDDEFGLRPVVMVPATLLKKDGNVFLVDDAVDLSTSIRFISSPNYWTNTDITLSIYSEAIKTMYKMAGDTTYKDYTGPLAIEENCVINVALERGTYSKDGITYNVTNIDKNPPSKFKENESIGYNAFTIDFDFEDDLSGLSTINLYYKLPEDNSWKQINKVYKEVNSPAKDSGETFTNKPINVSGLTKGGTVQYYADAYDVAGNIVTLYSKENPKTFDTQTYTINYKSNGNDVYDLPNSQGKVHGINISLSPTEPTRTGYIFKGWSRGGITEAELNTVSFVPGQNYTENGNLDLYAVWEAITYPVTYDANGGNGAPADQVKVFGDDLTLTADVPTRPGFDFLGWSLDPTKTDVDYPSGSIYNSNNELHLYAVWQRKTYTITYDANGGGNIPSPQTKNHGSVIQITEEKPTRIGYTFKGWATTKESTDIAYGSGSNYTADENITLYAIWEVDTADLSFNANLGENSSSAVETKAKAYGEDYVIGEELPKRDGYKLIGWSETPNATIPDYNVGDSYVSDSGNATLYAVWEPEEYEITLDSQNYSDGEMVVYQSTLTENIDEVTLGTPGKYKLEAWGAQGGSVDGVEGGKGGYSSGIIEIDKSTKVFVGVGGAGSNISLEGGYNGGGAVIKTEKGATQGATGGGATHISLDDGKLSECTDNEKVLIVAGGGGGAGGNGQAGFSSVQSGSGGEAGYAGGSFGNAGGKGNAGIEEKINGEGGTAGNNIAGGNGGSSNYSNAEAKPEQNIYYPASGGGGGRRIFRWRRRPEVQV